MTDRNAKADSSGDLHEIKALQAEIERLEAKLTQDPKDARCQLYKATQKWQQEAGRCNAEIKRLRELTENDGKEIGSYREGTGLRGENRRLRAALEDALPCLGEHDPEVWDIARGALNETP